MDQLARRPSRGLVYCDCASGISGDMLLGALVDLGINLAELQGGIDSLGLPSCRLVAREVRKAGLRATQVTVEHQPEHVHRKLSHIVTLIDRSDLSPRQRQLATSIFQRLAAAEAQVHGCNLEEVHFHEVGAVDSIADIVGVAIGWDLLGVDEVVASPVPVGSGFVEIAHGRCAIPAPATAELLRGVPLADFAPSGELTTPTGAAVLTTLTNRFGPLPAMTIEKIGLGAGEREYEHPNLLRLIVGTTSSAAAPLPLHTDQIVLLETNLDDTPGEQLGYCVEQLWQAGALDVAIVPLTMKKGRPGVQLAVQSPPAKADQLEEIVFRETTALGLRRQLLERRILPRRTVELVTPYGKLSGVVARLPDGSERFSPEYEVCRQAAERHRVPLRAVYLAVQIAFDQP